MEGKVKIGTCWLDGCSGCHMSLLDIDEGIVAVLKKADIVFGPLVDAQEWPEGVDVAVIEGAVSSQDDLKLAQLARARSKVVVALGDCAVTSNVPSMRNGIPTRKLLERVYVEAPVADAFTAKLVERMRALRTGGNGPAAEIDFGPFTSPRQIEIVEPHLADAVARGARVLTGGTRVGEGPAQCFAPTVLAGVDHSMAIMREETFGPIVPVMAVADVEEAIRLANDSDYGLQAGVFTQNLAHAWQAFETLEVGGVIINDAPIFRLDHMPYGGAKASGLGREGLRYAIEELTELRLLALQV